MNYLLKGLERLSVWVTDTALEDNSLYTNNMFLDIQADSISPNHIKSDLLKHGCPKDMVDWYYELPTHRNLQTTY